MVAAAALVGRERPAVSRPPAGRGPRLFYCCRLAVFHVGLNIIKRHIPFEKQELPC